MADTVDYLQSIRAIRPALAQQYRETVMSIGAAAVRDGFDDKLGGVFESGLPFTGPQSKAKVGLGVRWPSKVCQPGPRGRLYVAVC